MLPDSDLFIDVKTLSVCHTNGTWKVDKSKIYHDNSSKYLYVIVNENEYVIFPEDSIIWVRFEMVNENESK